MEDRSAWTSTLVKNHDENRTKTFILVKLSESFSNAIQEYSNHHQNNNNNNNSNTNSNNTNTTTNNNNHNHHNHHIHHHHHRHHHHNNNNKNNINNNNNHNKHHHQNGSTTTTTTTTTTPTNNYKRPKLQHNANNQPIEAPTIKFHGTRGAIKFPNGKSYDFSLQQSDNSVECIKQTKNKWESVGKMACCLHVKGKDDVYQRTRTKMEAAEQEKRKYCTKLLDKIASPVNSTSSKMVGRISSNPASLSSSSSSSSSSGSSGSASSSSSSSSSSNASINNNSSNYVYPDITNVKQFRKYKADFDQDYKEYQYLHGYLHKIEERFRNLRESLKQNVEGSPEWESAKEQIFKEYERVKGDNEFHKSRSKYKHLHGKLAHIKEKIFQFKRQHKDHKRKNKKVKKV